MINEPLADEIIFDNLTNNFLYKKHSERLLTIHMLLLMSYRDKESLYYGLGIDLLFEQLKLSYSKSVRKDAVTDEELTDLTTYANLLANAGIIDFDSTELYDEFAGQLCKLDDFTKMLCLASFRKEESVLGSEEFAQKYLIDQPSKTTVNYYGKMISLQLRDNPYLDRLEEKPDLSKDLHYLLVSRRENQPLEEVIANISGLIKNLNWRDNRDILTVTFFILNLNISYE